MDQQIINISNSIGFATGDSLNSAFSKVNDNFTELFDVTAIEYDTANVVVVLTDNTSTFENNVIIDQNLIIIGNISAIGDGGNF